MSGLSALHRHDRRWELGESPGNEDVFCEDPLDPRSRRSIRGRASALFQVERNAVHTPPLSPSLPRTVVEDVAEVRVAARTAHLGADHPVRAVLNELYGLRRNGFGEARPAGARVVLRAAIEEHVAAGGAVVEAGFVGVHVLTGERTLGRSLTQDGILLCREPLPPLLVGEGHLLAVGTHAESDRAAHAGTAQTAVSVGD